MLCSVPFTTAVFELCSCHIFMARWRMRAWPGAWPGLAGRLARQGARRGAAARRTICCGKVPQYRVYFSVYISGLGSGVGH